MISILLLAMLAGGGGLTVALMVFGAANKRLWVIPAVSACVFFGLVLCGVILSIMLPIMERTTSIQLPSPQQITEQLTTTTKTVMQVPPNFAVHSAVPVWFLGIRWIAILGLIGFVLIIRGVVSRRHGHGFWRVWPGIVVACFIGFIFFVRVNDSYEHAQISARSAREAADTMAANQQFIANQQHRAELMAQAHRQEQQKQRAIAHGDIHELMDKFEEPTIPNPSQPAAPEVTNVAATATAPAMPPTPPQPDGAVKSDQDADKPVTSSVATTKSDTSKSAAAPDHKNKKSGKALASKDAKRSQLVAQAKPADASSTKEESISESGKSAAEAKPETSTARPPWVDQPPKRTGNTRREVIATDDYATIEECYQAADVYLLLKTYNRMQQLTGQAAVEGPLPSLAFEQGKILVDGTMYSQSWVDDRLSSLRGLGIGPEYVCREIVAKDPKDNEPREYIETVQRSFGPMKKLYRQIEFTPAVDHELTQYWDASERRDRFAMVGVGAGSILGCIGLVFGLLKMDTWTKGYYTKRLFIGVPAAIIAGFLLLIMLGSHVAIIR
jgi:hypothetical protein